jgi:hypothetical protein
MQDEHNKLEDEQNRL